MNKKDYLTNKHFCPIPWTGFQYNGNGDVLNCIRSQKAIGNLKRDSIHDIIKNNQKIRQDMLDGNPGYGCDGCYNLEQGKNRFDIASDRIFYLKELKDVPLTTYEDSNNFELHQIDLRWSNVCNQACVYCGPQYSSKWQAEKKFNYYIEPSNERITELKEFVFSKIDQLKHVYLAGGEPLLMKENEQLLKLLLEHNPDVNIRVNTNLSKTGTPVFDLICQFKNVHWTVSVDEIEDEFEYVRYGGSWQDFLDNLNIINKLDHKISFNMLWFPLNFKSIFATVDYFKQLGYHNNSFVINTIKTPRPWDIRHLPSWVLKELDQELQKRIDEQPGYLLEDSYRNMLSNIQQPFDRKPEILLNALKELDQRRGLDSCKLFPELYKCLQD